MAETENSKRHMTPSVWKDLRVCSLLQGDLVWAARLWGSAEVHA